MLSFFTASTFNRFFNRVARNAARINENLQIFENALFSSDSLHDLNTSSFTTRFRKRVLNDVTTNANNRSAKKNKNRPSETKNKPHASRESRVESHATSYLSTSSLFTHIISRRRRRKPFLLPSSLTSTLSLFFSSFARLIPPLFAQPSPSPNQEKKKKKMMKNVLRDLIDDEIVNMTEYSSDPKYDASDAETDASTNEFIDVKSYVSESQQKFHHQMISEFEQKTYQPPAANRAVRRRNRTKRRHDKNLNIQWMIARKFEERPNTHLLLELRQKKNICLYCQAYQYPQECDSSNSKHKYWHCCFNDRVHNMIMSSKSDLNDLKTLKNDEIKETMRAFETKIQNSLHDLMHKMKNFDDNRARTKASKNFQEFIIFYNNVLFFCNELTTVNFKNSDWATFRCMRKIKHLLESLMTSESELVKFCQIHQIDSSQKTLKRRMNENVDDSVLHRETFLQFQRLLKKINLYVDSLKTCEDRFLKNSNLDTKIHLKQHDLSRQNKDIHNKPTFSEMTVIMILPDDMTDDQIIKRDILIQSIHDDMISILFWKSCYMSLRYPLIYLYDEQSWNKLIPLRDHNASKGLLARRPEQNQIERHDIEFENNDESESVEIADLNAEKKNENEDDEIDCDKRESTRVTQKKFYRYQLQINHLLYYLPFCDAFEPTSIATNGLASLPSTRAITPKYDRWAPSRKHTHPSLFLFPFSKLWTVRPTTSPPSNVWYCGDTIVEIQ